MENAAKNRESQPGAPPSCVRPIRYIFTTDTGEAACYWPSEMSYEDCAAVVEWIELLKKKIQRAGRRSPADPADQAMDAMREGLDEFHKKAKETR